MSSSWKRNRLIQLQKTISWLCLVSCLLSSVCSLLYFPVRKGYLSWTIRCMLDKHKYYTCLCIDMRKSYQITVPWYYWILVSDVWMSFIVVYLRLRPIYYSCIQGKNDKYLWGIEFNFWICICFSPQIFLGFLEKLTMIKVSMNQLTSIPESIGKLRAVEELDLSHNKLEFIPPSIGNLRWNGRNHIKYCTNNLVNSLSLFYHHKKKN